MAKVIVVGPDGKTAEIEESNLAVAESRGLRLQTSDEAQYSADQARYGGGVGNTIKAGLAGAARTLTLGLSDVVASDVGAGGALAKLREHNPEASITGEIAGAVAPAVLSGGGSALGAGTRLVEGAGKLAESSAARALTSLSESGVLGRIAAKGLTSAARGAAEGAVYGGAQAVSDAALSDHELSAEQILQHVGTGALLGGLVGGGVGATGEAVSAGASKLTKTIKDSIGEGGLGDMLTSLKENSALRASSATQSALAKLEAKGRSQEVAQDLLSTSDALGGKQILDTGGNVAKTLDNIDLVRKSVGKAKGDSLKALSDAGEVLGEGVDPRAIAQKLRSEMLDRVSNTPGLSSEAQATESLIAEWENLAMQRGDGRPLSLVEADAMKQELQNKAKRLFGKEMASFGDDLKVAAAGIVNGEIDGAASRIAKANGMQDVLDGFIEAKRMYGSLSEAQKLFRKGSERISGNRAISLTDYIFGVGAGALAGGPVGMVTGALGAMANKVLRERGRGVLASALQRIETTAVTGAAVREGESRLINAVDRFVGKAASAAGGALKAASRAAVIGEESGSYLRQRAAHEDPQDHHQKQIEELQRIVQNPAVTTDNLARATQQLAIANPKVSLAVQTKAVQAATFLLSKVPPRVQSQADMLRGTYRPVSRMQLAAFDRYVAAATNPHSVIEGLASGHVSREAAETMRALYPKTVEQLRTKIAERITDGANVSHKQMLVLSQFFDTPFSLTLDPAVVAQVQTNWAAQAAATAAQQAPSPQPGARVAGMSKASLGDSDLTRSQSLLAR